MKKKRGPSNKVYLLLGSNIGNSKKQLAKAIQLIQQKIGKVQRQSAVYQTAAWGNTNQPDFLNVVIVIHSKLNPADTITSILKIEKAMGRTRTEKNAPRIIDIDILFFNKEMINSPTLIVPHPQIQNRRFVLAPLNELSPQFIHPGLKKTIHYLLRVCPDKLAVNKI